MTDLRRPASILVGLFLLTCLVGGCQWPAPEPPSPATQPPTSARTLSPEHPAPTVEQELTAAPSPTTAPTPAVTETPEQIRPTSAEGQAAAWEAASQGIPGQVGVAAIAVAPSNAQVIYLAAYEPGGLYRSTDGGVTWGTARAGLESLVPLAVAVHATDPQVACVGTMTGGYRTVDGGQSWQPMRDLPSTPIYALAVAPDGGALFAGGEATGVWRSDDGGQSWSASGLVAEAATILSLAIAPNGMVYAGTAGQGVWISQGGGGDWQPAGEELAPAHVSALEVVADGQLYALGDTRLYRSQDGGQAWQALGPADFEALSFAAAPGGQLYLGSKGDGLALSANGGETWVLSGDELRHADITCLVPDPKTPEVAYLGTLHNGLYRTADSGQSWTLISGDLGRPVVAALAQDPAESAVYYAGTLDGVYRSEDGGGHWQLASAATGKVFVQGLAVSPRGDRVYAGTRSGIYLSMDRGTTWRWAEDIGEVSVLNVMVDPHDEDRVYAGSWGHNLLRSTDGGRTWASIHHGLETLSVHAFALDPADPQMLYAGTVEAVYRSIDGGESWQASPLGGRPLTTFALSVDPADPALVYAGTTDGVWRSTDRGQTWHAAGRESLEATVTALLLNQGEPPTLYAGTEHHGLYLSRDGGAQWQPWGLEGTSIYAILVDRSGTIWAGTDQGIFKR